MNISKSVREMILERFKCGASIQDCAVWYQQKPAKIESVIRDALKAPISNHKQEESPQ
jgi:hypothetical protein